MDLILARLDQIEAKIDALSEFKLPKYLSVKQVATHLGVTEGSIRTQLSRRQIPCFKMGNRTLIKMSDLEGLMIRFESSVELLKDY